MQSLALDISAKHPCAENWAALPVAAATPAILTVRRCSACHDEVYDLSKLSRKEIEVLVLGSAATLCGRITRRADGSMIIVEPHGTKAPMASLGLSIELACVPDAAFG